MTNGDYLTPLQAAILSDKLKHYRTERAIRYAASHDLIPGAFRLGGRWVIPLAGLLSYLHNPPAPGRKTKNKNKT